MKGVDAASSAGHEPRPDPRIRDAAFGLVGGPFDHQGGGVVLQRDVLVGEDGVVEPA